MTFCTNCGAKVVDGAKFCQKCGSTVASPDISSHIHRHEFSGKIYKCPNCGEVLESFTSTCPSCGFELRGTKATNSVRELALKLEAIESRREVKKSRSYKDHLYGEEITKTDEQKISLIRSFSIPNTKEDLYEFLILSQSNIYIDLYGNSVLGADARISVSDAWKAKFEQAYQKAKLLFKGDPRFDEIQQLYYKTHKDIKKSKGKQWRQLGITLGIFVAMIVGTFLLVRTSDSIDEKKEIARLDAIVTPMW